MFSGHIDVQDSLTPKSIPDSQPQRRRRWAGLKMAWAPSTEVLQEGYRCVADTLTQHGSLWGNQIRVWLSEEGSMGSGWWISGMERDYNGL